MKSYLSIKDSSKSNMRKNKLLFYIDCMGLGGAQRVMKNLIEHYSNAGVIVELVTDYLPMVGVEEYFISTDIKKYYLQEENNSESLDNFVRIKKLRKIIRESKPDLIVSFLGPPNIRMLLSTIGLKIKKIVSVRNDPHKEYGDGVKKIIANVLFTLADGVVFQTNEAASYFNNYVRKKSCIIYNPVDQVFFESRWKKKGTEIVSIGRLQKQKNPELLLRSFLKVAGEIPEYQLGFYGDGELKPKLQEIACASGMQNRVIFHGQTTDVPHVLENAALFVMSSDYEGMPNALMEAMAVGLPVISTDCPCGGPKELLNDKNGILVPCKDIDKMANAILMLIKDVDKREHYGAKASERAGEFISDRILEKWDNYFNLIMK